MCVNTDKFCLRADKMGSITDDVMMHRLTEIVTALLLFPHSFFSLSAGPDI